MKRTVPGTIGYAQAADRFIELSESITFEKLHRPILESIPTTESDVLDIGSGSGRDGHGVWQHIDHTDRIEALVRISEILNRGGIFAVALRHGPVGNGTHYFQASADETVTEATRVGLDLVLNIPNQASALPNKRNVTWTRLAFRRNV